jgi:hypothetical protein
MQLRLTVLATGAFPIPDATPVSKDQELFDEEGQPRDGTWARNLGHFIDELLFYAKALAQAPHEEGARTVR